MAHPDLERIVESARHAGLEFKEEDAADWLRRIDLAAEGDEVTLDHRTGVFGHSVAMLDFSPVDIAFFRAIGALVEIPDEDDVETALALSGSAAQSKIQTYPGDADFFERVNIKAPTREDACRRIGEVLRKKALDTLEGETYRLIEVKFGDYPFDVARGTQTMRAGTPIAWSADDVVTGQFTGVDGSGGEVTIRWKDVAHEPGWCKLDWVVADPVRRQVANASNMLDVTWEAPDGSITPLDGYLDPYFQEVYLNAEEIPLFNKLAQHVSADALDDYVKALEKEVRKYISGEGRNVGKAAKRMYNIFRLNGRYVEAAFLREIFDEPATVLYQVYAVVRTIDEAIEGESTMDRQTVIGQVDRAIIGVIRALEGVEEEEIVAALLSLRDGVSRPEGIDSGEAEAARERLLNLVNNFFYEKMTALPELRDYMEGLQTA
ncbi:MAG: hypothetical protein WEA29_04520 [Acidimicrobiia bacterium]